MNRVQCLGQHADQLLMRMCNTFQIRNVPANTALPNEFSCNKFNLQNLFRHSRCFKEQLHHLHGRNIATFVFRHPLDAVFPLVAKPAKAVCNKAWIPWSVQLAPPMAVVSLDRLRTNSWQQAGTCNQLHIACTSAARHCCMLIFRESSPWIRTNSHLPR